MRKIAICAAALASVAIFVTGCSDKHFMTDAQYRKFVKEDLQIRIPTMEHRHEQLFGVFDRPDVTTEQREALEFLYAYIPLVDLAEYDGEYFLRQVDGAFRARDFFSWGGRVPEDVFRHFVLIPRVANEYLDESRDVMFDELKDRIKDMSMYDAALEVSHWCHEYVTYRATDPRTMAPLAQMKTAWGRCGEEAAFTGAAMRAVGIPARQVFTPRWVHTDSNHAWIEVWVDGKWYYLGACEPEPELNMAWFTGPARRAMLVQSQVIGRYEGKEQRVSYSPYATSINSLHVYGDTRRLAVKVVDESGQPVEGATLRFKVYNYGDMTSIYTAMSGSNGDAELTTGNGDVMLWASKGDRYGYVKSTMTDNDVTVVLDRRAGREYREDYVMNPPVEQPFTVVPTDKAEENTRRLLQEDSIRMAYMATFATKEFAHALAGTNFLNREKTWHLLRNAEGNWQDIARFMTDNHKSPYILPFLMSLKIKDLQDTPREYLQDHFDAVALLDSKYPADFAAQYILSPRISTEIIMPWRRYLQQESAFAAGLDTPAKIIAHVRDNIQLAEGQNYMNIMLTPRGVDELRYSTARSRDIYFVALCRAAGIPSRIEQATGKVQYYEDKEWKDVSFVSRETPKAAPKGKLVLTNGRGNILKPLYRNHYSVAKFSGGDFQVLDLSGHKGINDFPFTAELDEGYYRILTSSRANDGSTAISTEYFNVEAGKTYRHTVKLPEVGGKLFVKGVVDMNTIIYPRGSHKTTLKGIANNRGLILVFADPDREPTKHILQDLPAQAAALEEWGGGILFMVPSDKLSASFRPEQYTGLPTQLMWATDEERALLRDVQNTLQLGRGDNFPLALYISINGGILYSSEGYRLGIGESLLKTILQEKQVLDSLEK